MCWKLLIAFLIEFWSGCFLYSIFWTGAREDEKRERYLAASERERQYGKGTE